MMDDRRVAALAPGWSLRSRDLLRGWSLGEQPRAKSGYQRSTLLAVQPAESRISEMLVDS